MEQWTEEQAALVQQAAGLWEAGLTQEQIAAQMELTIHTLRYKLLNAGVKFGRAGRMVWTANNKPIDEEEAA